MVSENRLHIFSYQIAKYICKNLLRFMINEKKLHIFLPARGRIYM